MSLIDKSASELRKLLQSGDTTAGDVTAAFCDRIEAVDENIKAFLYYDRSRALEQAEQIDKRRQSGEKLGKLAGVTIAVQFVDSQTLSFIAPTLPSGRSTLTVQGRGGLAQSALLVEPVSLDQLAVGSITTIAGDSSFSGDGSAAESALLW